jgi:hypothetical protein
MAVTLLEALQNTDDFLGRLSECSITTGHFKGTLIHHPDFPHDGLTFTTVAAEIKHRYGVVLSPILQRHADYQKNSQSSMSAIPHHRGGILLAPITVPLKAVADLACWMMTDYVKTTKEEEKTIKTTMAWRQKAMNQLEELARNARAQLLAQKNSCCRKVIVWWDECLDSWSAWRDTTFDHDTLIFFKLQEERIRQEGKDDNLAKEESYGLLNSSIWNYAAAKSLRYAADVIERQDSTIRGRGTSLRPDRQDY